MNFSKLDQYLAKLPACGIPGCALAISYKGKIVYRGNAGYADFDLTHRVSYDDIYYVFSISKITTCVAAMRLVEQGVIGLDDPVSKYLPAYTYLNVKNAKGKPEPAQTVMTVRHLFSMTGGLNYDLAAQPLMREKQNPHAGTVSFPPR
ncbi:MAG: beta-lactamase family protein, partial [Ruminococcaceae bacterium]|nr:beta-lactamase family protein [Oscillospiraceae bacterium]